MRHFTKAVIALFAMAGPQLAIADECPELTAAKIGEKTHRDIVQSVSMIELEDKVRNVPTTKECVKASLINAIVPMEHPERTMLARVVNAANDDNDGSYTTLVSRMELIEFLARRGGDAFHASVLRALGDLTEGPKASKAVATKALKAISDGLAGTPKPCAEVDGTGAKGSCVYSDQILSATRDTAAFQKLWKGDRFRVRISPSAFLRKGWTTKVAFTCHASPGYSCTDLDFSFPENLEISAMWKFYLMGSLGLRFDCGGDLLEGEKEIQSGETLTHQFVPTEGENIRTRRCVAAANNPFTLRITTTRAIMP